MSDGIIDKNLSNNQLIITPGIRTFLNETAKWGKLIAIIGFVFMALMILLGLGMSFFMGSMLSELTDVSGIGAMGGAIGFFYIIIALIYIFPILYLYRFSTKMKIALAQDDQQYLHESFQNLKSLYKFLGLFIAIVIGFYALSLILILIFGGIGSLM